MRDLRLYFIKYHALTSHILTTSLELEAANISFCKILLSKNKRTLTYIRCDKQPGVTGEDAIQSHEWNEENRC